MVYLQEKCKNSFLAQDQTASIPKNLIEKARKIQKSLAKRVITYDSLDKELNLIAGVDVAYVNSLAIGVATNFDFYSTVPIQDEVVVKSIIFPYIPTLLAFREIVPVISGLRKLHIRPDLILVDGHGYAHPDHIGFASHLGVVLDVPTIGVAKGLLCGEVSNTEYDRLKPILHEDKVVGAALKTQESTKPIYVSIGHRVSLQTAIKIVLHFTEKHRIPEPIRRAHIIAQKAKDTIMSNKFQPSDTR